MFLCRLIVFSLLLSASLAASRLPVESGQLERTGSARVELVSSDPAVVGLRFNDPAWDSGVRVRPPAGAEYWDFSGGAVLAVDVENRSRDRQLRLTMNISSGSREQRTLAQSHAGIGLNPGETRTLRLHLPHDFVHRAPRGVPGIRVMDTGRVNSVEFFMQWPFEAARDGFVDARIGNLRLEGEPDRAAAVAEENFFPFIDRYGQYRHGDWREKIRSDADLRRAHAEERRELANVRPPAEWNRFGGWANGPRLRATGHFRTEKYRGKWYLVDPEGRLFFSHGIDVLRPHTDATPTRDRAHWFDFATSGEPVPFNDLNLRIKYGRDNYEREFYDTLLRRLRHWGMNTIGNWGHSDLMLRGEMPYTLQLTDYDRSLPRLAGGPLKFYDVFDPAYIDAMRNLVETASRRDPAVARSLTDPMCIGYFIDNEINYGNRGARQIFGDLVLKSPAEQAAKQEWERDLRVQYEDDIAALNRAWGTSHASWEAWLADTATVPETAAYRTDSAAFFRKAVDQYFRLSRDAIKSVAPHRLYLGSRFISTDAVRRDLYEASEKYCDVLTVNVYAHSVANFGGGGFPDMPVLIGEFHFGVLDRGMFRPGVVSAGVTQEDRALAYTRFLQGALAHPNIVGTHWFQFRDQPLTGRWDGEGYAIGFVDVADTPYRELGRAARQVGEHMYRYRLNGVLNDFPSR